MPRFLKSFYLAWNNLVDHLPEILGGIVCFIATIFIANSLSKLVSNYTLKRSKDSLISNFIGKIVWTVIFILGTVMALGILGLGTISDKILAGAGITTFIVGFALKDIGENFLSGLILAFGRPFRVGNLIECTNVKGIVKDMTMRQTTVEAENGKIILIPNSIILKNPLIKYSNDDNHLRQEFMISVEAAKAREAIKIIRDTVASFDYVMKAVDKPVKVVIDSVSADKVKLLVIFWFDTENFKGSRSGSKTEIMMTVFDKLAEKDYEFSG
ncbi:MAG: mechanosensitive ion channel domain-containing protein [Bacteroidota bacterium]